MHLITSEEVCDPFILHQTDPTYRSSHSHAHIPDAEYHTLTLHNHLVSSHHLCNTSHTANAPPWPLSHNLHLALLL